MAPLLTIHLKSFLTNSSIGAAAGKFLGVRRILPEFPQTYPKKFWVIFCTNISKQIIFWASLM